MTTKTPVRAWRSRLDGKTLAVKNQMGPFTLYETAKWSQTKIYRHRTTATARRWRSAKTATR
jgi:hypothetical protein